MQPRTEGISGKRILLGVTGSIAAYKAVELLRRMRDRNAEVRVIMTRSAARFVSKLTFEALSSLPVLTDDDYDRAAHVEITAGLDLAVIAPATGNIIGKVAAGIADDVLSSSILALDCPLVLAPAMNDRMYRNRIVRKNIAELESIGIRFIEPESGTLACGTVGQGRLADTGRILDALDTFLAPPDLTGADILITAGPTRERIDAARFISNGSTGKMGYALASAARARGAVVTLISGPTMLAPPSGVRFLPVESADEMHRAVTAHLGPVHAVIMAAAVSDFRPSVQWDRKIKKEDADAGIFLERTIDILKELGGEYHGKLLVGFAAETDDPVGNAQKKLKEKNLDLIVLNDLLSPGSGFGTETNQVTIIDRSGRIMPLPLMSKQEVAGRLLDKVRDALKEKGFLP